MNENLSALIDAEFNFFKVLPQDVVAYLIIAILCDAIIRWSGPIVLNGKYLDKISPYNPDDIGTLNIVYRIISPVIWSFLLLLLFKLALSIASIPWNPNARWLSLLFYWIIVIAIKMPLVDPSRPLWTLLSQAVVSIGTAIYFDWAVVCQWNDQGLAAFDQSNIGWQLLIVVFFAAANVILAGVARGRSRYQAQLRNASFYSRLWSGPGYSLPSIDYSTEKRFYEYRRKYRKLFPDRVIQDKLLLAFTYLVMYMEDTNRPAWIRRLERSLFRTGLVKSTGIMQVRGNVALSDEDSIIEATPIITKIWDDFLRQASKSRSCSSSSRHPSITFFKGWYRYKYREVYQYLSSSINELYGEYCGTSTLDVRNAFAFATVFVFQSEKPIDPNDVFVKSTLFDEYTNWIEAQELCFIDSTLSIVPWNNPALPCGLNAICNTAPTEESAKEAIKAISKVGLKVVSVRFVDGIHCSITARGTEEVDEEAMKNSLEGWLLVVHHAVG